MKITILTFYWANNVGAFLQALGMQNVLESLGYEVEFAIFKNESINNNIIRRVLGYLKKKNYGMLVFKYNMAKKFSQSMGYLKLAKEPFDIYKEYDCILIGSDEVWNLQGRNTVIPYRLLFGEGINAKKIITYAASGNNTLPNKVSEMGINFSCLDYISVRDENTFNMVYQIAQIKPEIVCDPTILMPSWKSYICDVPERDYILIYSYETPKEIVKSIKKFAKERHKKLISVDTYNPWCDKIVSVDPIGFLSWLSNADYVFTSTFHGTVLSTILNKDMAVYASDSHKILYFLEQVGLTKRIVNSSNVNDVFKEKIDYKTIDKILSEMRKCSMNYLKKAMEE